MDSNKKANIRRFFKKMVSWSGLFFFGVAAYMIYRQLSAYELADIKAAVVGIPAINLILACLASFAGYIVLSFYDYLALRYIRRKLYFLKWMFAGIIGFSVSNNAGHAIVSGGAIRYRLYTRWRFRAGEIVRMVLFSGFTYLFGCFGLMVIGFLLMPAESFEENPASHVTTVLTLIGSVIGLTLYFAATLFYKKPINIRGVSFRLPSFKMALAQVTVGAADTFCASLILYVMLIQFIDVPFGAFLGVFVIAQVLGVFSQVPGGLGVFEGLFVYLLPGDHSVAELYGALIMYRIIYYLVPLVGSGILLMLSERKWIRFRDEKYRQPYRPKHLPSGTASSVGLASSKESK